MGKIWHQTHRTMWRSLQRWFTPASVVSSPSLLISQPLYPTLLQLPAPLVSKRNNSPTVEGIRLRFLQRRVCKSTKVPSQAQMWVTFIGACWELQAVRMGGDKVSTQLQGSPSCLRVSEGVTREWGGLKEELPWRPLPKNWWESALRVWCWCRLCFHTKFEQCCSSCLCTFHLFSF